MSTIGDLKLKCSKCGLPHKTKNCEIKCGYCLYIGHRCWKWGKHGKTPSTTNNFLTILVNDEDVTLEQLNKLCGTKFYFFGNQNTMKVVELVEMGTQNIGIGSFEAVEDKVQPKLWH